MAGLLFEENDVYLRTLERAKLVASEKSLMLNVDEKRVNKIVGHLTSAKERFGTYSCPCKKDHPICPCDQLEKEIEIDGYCKCRLFFAS